MTTEGKRIYVGCFSFDCDDKEEIAGEERGTFQILVEAADRQAALSGCRAKLNEIAESLDPLGPIIVYLDSLLEIPPNALCRGLLFHHVSVDCEGTAAEEALPSQETEGATAYWGVDFPELIGEKVDDSDGEITAAVPFWSGVESFRVRWKLYWCETEDHDEDWFVVARSAAEATEYYEGYEGYDEDDANAELVCVLPRSEQDRAEPGWPDHHLLEACGAEVLNLTPQDGAKELRAQVGSGSRLVRIKGRIFSEGDIVGNTLSRVGDKPKS